MGDSHRYPPDSYAAQRSGVMWSAMAGAVLGAAGLAWWLLAEAERRRVETRQLRLLRLSRLQDGSEAAEAPRRPSAHGGELPDKQLHDKVHELNQAIDDVRRQLEAMDTAR